MFVVYCEFRLEIQTLVNILATATNPVSFPDPTVENTCFLSQLFTHAGGRREELVSILTQICAKP